MPAAAQARCAALGEAGAEAAAAAPEAEGAELDTFKGAAGPESAARWGCCVLRGTERCFSAGTGKALPRTSN